MSTMSNGFIEDEKGEAGNTGYETLAAACRAWSALPEDEKARKYVIEADIFGNPQRQLSHEESERIAQESLNPRIR
jgi:hypothetical protein